MTAVAHRRGLTLIESLATIVLLAFVTAVLFPRATGLQESLRISSMASGIHRVLEEARVEARVSGPIRLEVRGSAVVAAIANSHRSSTPQDRRFVAASHALPPGYGVMLIDDRSPNSTGVSIDALGRSPDLIVRVIRANGSHVASWRVNGLTGLTHSFTRRAES